MTEYQKAMSGYLFTRGSKELFQLRTKAQDLCFDYNNARPSDNDKKQQILHCLIGEIKGNIHINAPFYCDYGKFISVGDNFFANYNLKIIDGGKVKFGDNVLIGPNCTFVTANHPTDPNQRLENLQIYLPITIGNNVWFGSNVTVLPGVHIGDNSVIAAGSVVTRDIDENVLAMGIPCKAVRQLNKDDAKKYPLWE